MLNVQDNNYGRNNRIFSFHNSPFQKLKKKILVKFGRKKAKIVIFKTDFQVTKIELPCSEDYPD